MKELVDIDRYIAQATGALEQIATVDEMIALHQRKNDLMLTQYQDQRKKILKELSALLSRLNVRPDDLVS